MKPLVVLLVTFVIAWFLLRVLRHEDAAAFAGRIALSVMLLFTATAHFAFTRGMAMMIPAFIPYKRELVYCTGIIEILAAAGLHIPQLREVTAWLLIVFFILLLPANINAALRKIDYQKGTYSGNGISYLWFRVPLQVLLIVWTYASNIKS